MITLCNINIKTLFWFFFDFGYPVIGSCSFLSRKDLIYSTFHTFHIEPTRYKSLSGRVVRTIIFNYFITFRKWIIGIRISLSAKMPDFILIF